MSEVSELTPMLQQIQGRLTRIEERLDRIGEDTHNVMMRMTNMEENLAGLNRRLDLVETP